MNPKKKLRRCRGLGLDSGLDLAISRFIYSVGCMSGYLQLTRHISYKFFIRTLWVLIDQVLMYIGHITSPEFFCTRFVTLACDTVSSSSLSCVPCVH